MPRPDLPQSGIDHFPYRGFFRGRYDSEHPIVFERRAGFSNVECAPVRTIPLTPLRTELTFQTSSCASMPSEKKCIHISP